MIAFELTTRASELQEQFQAISNRLGLEEKRSRLQELDALRQDPEFWTEQSKARQVGQEISRLERVLERTKEIEKKLSDLRGIEELVALEDDPHLEEEYASTLSALASMLDQLEIQTFLSGKYDGNDVIFSIHAGQGGTEAQDWASMVSRMYTRYFERKGWKTEIVDESRAEEGIKSITYIVHGEFAYGFLKHETGAHRLVRLSPFNADNLRQTSFVGVEVMPLIEEDDKEMEIKPDELEWQFTRAGGHGGQNVNKVNSAVILRHIPTQIVVECRQERYQEQNKKTALSILKSKLAVIEEEKHQAEISSVKGEHKIAGWGNQIRNYVLHPYHLVKDTRTKIESSDTESVLDGDLDLFVQSSVRML